MPETEIPVLCFWRDLTAVEGMVMCYIWPAPLAFPRVSWLLTACAENSGPCFSHSDPSMHVPGLSPELLFAPSPAEFQHHRLTVKERRLLLVTSVLLPDSLLRLTAGSQEPLKAPSKIYLPAPWLSQHQQKMGSPTATSLHNAGGLCWAGRQPC